MNAANEVAVDNFLEGRCGFTDIAGAVRAVMDRWLERTGVDAAGDDSPDLQTLRETDRLAREMAMEHAGTLT